MRSFRYTLIVHICVTQILPIRFNFYLFCRNFENCSCVEKCIANAIHNIYYIIYTGFPRPSGT